MLHDRDASFTAAFGAAFPARPYPYRPVMQVVRMWGLRGHGCPGPGCDRACSLSLIAAGSCRAGGRVKDRAGARLYGSWLARAAAGAGLTVAAELHPGQYPRGIQVSDREMRDLEQSRRLAS